jgi:DNA-binding transcriptional regulator YiaG
MEQVMTAHEFDVAVEALHIRRRQIADLLGVDRNTVKAWHDGSEPVPKFVSAWISAVAFGQAFGVPGTGPLTAIRRAGLADL